MYICSYIMKCLKCKIYVLQMYIVHTSHESKCTLYCTWKVHQKTTVRNCIIESVWNIFGYGEGSLFMGRLYCRFSTSVFIVKRWSKTSDYLTRNNLDLSTPPFYSLKRRKKAGFRTQSHITDRTNILTYTPRHSREYGTTNGRKWWKCAMNVHTIYFQCTFNAH